MEAFSLLNKRVHIIREEKALYIVVQTESGDWSSVEKLCVWSAKKYLRWYDEAGVSLVGSTYFGRHVSYQLLASVSVFDMTVSSTEGGYTRRCAVDLPEMQPLDVEKPKSLWELAGLIPGKEESSKKMAQAPQEQKSQS